MKYPKTLTSFNNAMGILSGGLVLIMSFLQVMEGILRTVLSKPTSWSMDLSIYLLVGVIFLGSSYAFQEKGHVKVDFVINTIGRKSSKTIHKGVAEAGYVLSLIYLTVFLINSIKMALSAVKYNQLTLANFQIPVVYLYVIMGVGAMIMIITVCYIIMDIVCDGKKYL